MFNGEFDLAPRKAMVTGTNMPRADQCGTTTDQTSLLLVTDIQGVASIKAVFNRSMAVKRDGTFWMWGNNDSGEFGDHTMTDRTRPVQILDL